MADWNLCDFSRARITAAAGHGKTQLIATSLSRHNGPLPVLVLTHTNAGVHSLSQRLQELSVPSHLYRLDTIDAFMLRLVRSFPSRSEYTLNPNVEALNYPRLRQAAVHLVSHRHIDDIVTANFSRLFVDEYQDCNRHQHHFVQNVSRILPTCVLGDPLQAVFGFAGPLARWQEVGAHFTEHRELTIPWRWRNAGNADLGTWLENIRDRLLNNQSIDLGTSPDCVIVRINNSNSSSFEGHVRAARCSHAHNQETVLVIGDSRNETSRHNIARRIRGLTPIEPVDHTRSLIPFMDSLDLTSPNLVLYVLEFAKKIMIGLDSQGTVRRLQSISNGRNRTRATDMEIIALELKENPSHSNVKALLNAIRSADGIYVFRPMIFYLAITALNDLMHDHLLTPAEAGRRTRERARHRPREMPKRGIGSTLLLKGLECDHTVILEADSLAAKDLYVALTRAKTTVTVCSATSILNSR